MLHQLPDSDANLHRCFCYAAVPLKIRAIGGISKKSTGLLFLIDGILGVISEKVFRELTGEF